MAKMSTFHLFSFYFIFCGRDKRLLLPAAFQGCSCPGVNDRSSRKKVRRYILSTSDGNELEVRRHCHQSSEACVCRARHNCPARAHKQGTRSFTNSVKMFRKKESESYKDSQRWTETSSFRNCLVERGFFVGFLDWSATSGNSRGCLLCEGCFRGVKWSGWGCVGGTGCRGTASTSLNFCVCFWWANGNSA